MLRWCLSTVRAFGGRDSNKRFSSSQISRLSKFKLDSAHAEPPAVPLTDLFEGQDSRVVSLSSAVSCPTSPTSRSSAITVERHIPCPSTGYCATHSLRRFLSPENSSSDHPLVCTPATLRSLYYRAESRNQLDMLDSKMLSLLMGLFGSLSIDARVSVVYKVPLASRLLKVSTCRTYWAFVLKVAKYKLGRKMTLQDSDRFWLMCAELASTRNMLHSKLLPVDAYNAILRARTHYHIIRRHSRRPGVHVYYLETLLATRDPRLLDLAACDLSFLLRSHRLCHPQLQRLLYHLVIQHGRSLSSRSQEIILAALWSRVSRGTNEFSDSVPENDLSNINLGDHNTDATSIARSLSATLFGFADHFPDDESANSLNHLLSVFSPAHALSLRWDSLYFFSVFRSSEILHFNNRIHWTTDHAVPRVALYWQVIFDLAITEKLLPEQPFAPQVKPITKEDVVKKTRALYQLWLSVVESGWVSQDLSCAIALSFFRIASLLAHADLFFDLQGLCCPENCLQASRPALQKLLAAQYIAAAARIQGPLSDVVQAVLHVFSQDLEQQHQVLSSAVQVLAPLDPSLACTLYTSSQGQATDLDPGTTHTLAMSFARHNALHQTIFFLNQDQFSLEERGVLVSTIARSLRENPRIRHPRSVLLAITNELAVLYRSHVPPEHFRGHLEQLLVILSQHGRGSQLLTVVLSILKMSPSFFQRRFFIRYCHVLIRHKQIATVRRLLDSIRVVHPTIARSLSITNRVALQTEAFRGLKRIAPVRRLLSLRISSRLRRCPHVGPSIGCSLQELLKSGRMLAAKQIFARAALTITSSQCTALGNILLHGVSHQPTPRNGRRVRKVLALLDNLVKSHGFQPDRVTVNILIKVMISWRSAFNSPRLRALFDQLVRGGYPAGDFSPLHPPFGTRETQFSGSSGISKLSSSVSFEKHSRPLFKMFIKAFYLCNDVEAARKVVGILKVEEYKHDVAKRMRQKARSEGRAKADERM